MPLCHENNVFILEQGFLSCCPMRGDIGRSTRNSNPVMTSSTGDAKHCSDHGFRAPPSLHCPIADNLYRMANQIQPNLSVSSNTQATLEQLPTQVLLILLDSSDRMITGISKLISCYALLQQLLLINIKCIRFNLKPLQKNSSLLGVTTPMGKFCLPFVSRQSSQLSILFLLYGHLDMSVLFCIFAWHTYKVMYVLAC